jgi:hypothetical protein
LGIEHGIHDGALQASLKKNRFRSLPIVHIADCLVHSRSVGIEQKPNATGKATLQNGEGDVVATVGDPLGDPLDRELNRREREIDELHPPAGGTEAPDQA